jgi:signal transduction histidine kinase
MSKNRIQHSGNGPVMAISIAVCALVVGLGWTFWMRGQSILRSDLRDRLRSTASIASNLIDAKDIQMIHSANDMDTAAFRRLVAALQSIRHADSHVRYAYVMRRTNDPLILEFVADADALGTIEELDINGNGIMESNEEGSHPGERYDITDMPKLQGEAFEYATVDTAFTKDQWGILISGYAPIRDAKGNTIAVLGIDMVADDFIALSQRIFSPFALLVVALAGLFIAGLIQWYSMKRRAAANTMLNKERSGLLQLALHRLGTPLTIFKWSLEILADCAGGKACPIEDIDNHIRQMRTGITSMDDVLHQLLEVEQVEGGGVRNNPRPTPVRSAVASVIEDLQSTWEPMGQGILIDRSCDTTVNIDPNILKGVLREIVQNACTFSPKDATIRISARCKRGEIAINVIDAGCGVPATEHHRIFQKFARGSNAHLCHPNGAGLGLYIARQVVEHAGGKIWMESEEGKGTTVSFTLPTA